MTNFEIEITYNMICRPGQVVRIHTKETTSGRNFIMTWKKWTIVEVYDHHIVMKSEYGYRESFTRIDIVEMIRRGEIRWKSLLENI
ncbi:hypothetical protein DWW43_00585 [Clostridium sp. AF15-41]|uniref:hypothetical protein n=1 Tax=Clostridium sp. AF15-41 TaxID=2292996 RepID=UPI000E708126|nr:hypothetical protein [Clostridium sp. AF15-41]RJX02590.1 hypothetical protein DWW43_00585 [Clostridium sp. AF15-41]